MHIVKLLGIILLAVFIFFTGLGMLTGLTLPGVGTSLLGLVGVAAGVLLLISAGRRCEK